MFCLALQRCKSVLGAFSRFSNVPFASILLMEVSKQILKMILDAKQSMSINRNCLRNSVSFFSRNPPQLRFAANSSLSRAVPTQTPTRGAADREKSRKNITDSISMALEAANCEITPFIKETEQTRFNVGSMFLMLVTVQLHR